MSDFEILNERELEHLCRSPGDDVDMSLVSCVVAEIRATRSSLATSTALAAEQAGENERLKGCLVRANADTEKHERLWYLVQDERDAAIAQRDEAVAKLKNIGDAWLSIERDNAEDIAAWLTRAGLTNLADGVRAGHYKSGAYKPEQGT